ncbi:MAG: XrtA-associated tyrosine autokinase [Gammaproteobacteria bacterium]|nr:XrtA-associated tyrosine autokinase [Gammaproteobacteria bacterium]MBU1414881.1 XrtA-associated tyrosine autokinase [Gammaproteobacteria bacterium]
MSLIEKAVERLDGLRRDPAKNGSVAPQWEPSVNAVGGGGEMRSEGDRKGVPSGQYVELDLGRLQAAGFIVPGVSASLIAEEFRVLKRPLLANVSGSAAPIRNANLIMVTSSLPGEGKSFSAINLAISIAMELDRTVLLVDADVARPSLPRELGLPEQKGLLDVLQDETLKLSDVLLRTNIDKLTILTAGTHDPHATELLASETMGRLLDEIARRYSDRIVIFDSPPLLVTTESRALAARMGQIVFVVRAEETSQQAVKDALGTIESCPVKLLVLNQARNVENVAYGYEYGYGY